MDMPHVLYGTAWKKDETARLVRTALERGFRGIDTACQPKHYDEAGVGAGIAESGIARDALYLQTKFTGLTGHDPQRIPYDPAASLATQIEQSLAASLANLRTDYLDALVLHSPLPSRADTLAAWRVFESFAARGVVSRLGISNCYEPSLLAALHAEARIKPTIVQNRFYADTDYDRATRAFCRANGMVYQSFWTLSANPGLLASATITQLARRHARTPAQILFRWLAHEGVVPLTGTRSTAHMDQALAIGEFELAATERAAIEALL